MASEPIYKVFVSSTFRDLREERAEVQKALLKLNCFPVGMELFPAADDDTWDFIKEQINGSDYYVVLVAGRYGSLDQDGISFTEKEYDYAREREIPSIGFVHADRAKIPSGQTDSDPHIVQKLDAFIGKIKRRPAREFSNPHQLALEVTTSFVDLKRTKPRIGFVRTNEAVDYRKYAELLEKNTELEKQLRDLQVSEQLFRHHDQKIVLRFVCDGAMESIPVAWSDVFLVVASLTLDNRGEVAVRNSFIDTFGARINPTDSQYQMAADDFQTVREHLFALNLINIEIEYLPAIRIPSCWGQLNSAIGNSPSTDADNLLSCGFHSNRVTVALFAFADRANGAVILRHCAQSPLPHSDNQSGLLGYIRRAVS